MLKSFVIDFIKDSGDSYTFLQIKNVEDEKILFDKIKYLKALRLKKGLDLEEKKCESVFCKKEYFYLVEKLEIALIGKQILSNNWNKAGSNLERNDELNIYFKDYNKLKNMKDDNLSILSPFWNIFENLFRNKPQVNKSNLKLHNTCDLCHKILKLYANKKELEHSGSKQNLLALNKYQKMKAESITINDYSNIIDILSFNIPGFDNKDNSKPYKNYLIIKRRSSNSYFYGYNPIVDSVNLISLYEKNIPSYQNPSTRNFLIENRNNTMKISNLPNISKPIPRKQKSQKEKNKLKLLKLSSAYNRSSSLLKSMKNDK